MNKNSYINTLSNHSPCSLRNSPDSPHCPKPLRSEKVLRLDFAIEEGTTRPSLICLTIEGTVRWPCLHCCRYGKWRFDGACHIPHACACQMCSTLIQTIWHHPTYPTYQFIEKKIQWWTKKTSQPLSSTVIKMCLSLHSSLNTSRKNVRSMSIVDSMLSSSLLLLKDQGP